MAQATISQFRHLIRTLNYVVSTHAAEELEDDNLNIKIGFSGKLFVITVYVS